MRDPGLNSMLDQGLRLMFGVGSRAGARYESGADGCISD